MGAVLARRSGAASAALAADPGRPRPVPPRLTPGVGHPATGITAVPGWPAGGPAPIGRPESDRASTRSWRPRGQEPPCFHPRQGRVAEPVGADLLTRSPRQLLADPDPQMVVT